MGIEDSSKSGLFVLVLVVGGCWEGGGDLGKYSDGVDGIGISDAVDRIQSDNKLLLYCKVISDSGKGLHVTVGVLILE